MTEEELKQERENQRANGQVPKYSGAHSNLSEEEKEAFREEGRKPAIRFRVPENHTYLFHDIVRGDINFESSDFDDWVIVIKDGFLTSNFDAAVDDHLMHITNVLIG